jgi:hypothetical protein
VNDIEIPFDWLSSTKESAAYFAKEEKNGV